MNFFPRFTARLIPIPPEHLRPKNKKNSKFLKQRPLPLFECKKYNKGFEDGYKHAIKLIKQKEKGL